MRKFTRITAFAILFSLAFSYTASACTTFFINKNGEMIFGKNYDFMIGYGMAVINQRGVSKFSDADKDKKLNWISKYGSVTSNQFGKEFPSGGMNEAGLVIELMWLDGTEYPSPDDRAGIGNLQWIQYQLDNFATLEEVIQSDASIRITKKSVPLHYLVADKEGNSGTIEFFEGKMVYHEGSSLPYSVLTNDTYSDSKEYIKEFEGFGGSKPLRNGKGSLDRFVTTCKLVKEYDPATDGNAIDHSFSTLDKVAQGDYTRWNIVYDIKNLSVNFRTRDSRKIKKIVLSEIALDCGAEQKAIDIDADVEGDISKKMPSYTTEMNRELINKAYDEVPFLTGIPKMMLTAVAEFPEQMKCSDEKKGGTTGGTTSSNNNGSRGFNYLYLILPIILAAGSITFIVLRKRPKISS